MAILKEGRRGIKVKIVTSAPDLCVYVTENKTEARDSDYIWYFDKSSGEEIEFVKSSADLEVQYVTSKSAAGWKNRSHKLQGRIG
ncbi:MAG: DUF6150 family protein [Proteobacteria bacterium]|nr:DUF6150 family protein [Pseudomonadota bacterium]MCL2307304.1 DUF6150 family protein [Pseudomonadota bacterium]